MSADDSDRIKMLEHQCTTILYLSAVNMFINVATILTALVAVLA